MVQIYIYDVSSRVTGSKGNYIWYFFNYKMNYCTIKPCIISYSRLLWGKIWCNNNSYNRKTVQTVKVNIFKWNVQVSVVKSWIHVIEMCAIKVSHLSSPYSAKKVQKDIENMSPDNFKLFLFKKERITAPNGSWITTIIIIFFLKNWADILTVS